MTRTSMITWAVGAGLALAATAGAWAQTQPQSQNPTQARAEAQERIIYGNQLMTPQERNEYRQRMRELKTLEEREQFRKEHHAKMQERAKERGVKLPDEPPARGAGAGARGGAGVGLGAGAGPRGGRP